MYDRSKLSKIDWKYIVIDEAQRMKDRESVLARDLDRYRCQRRLLLTGTPLQVFRTKLLMGSFVLSFLLVNCSSVLFSVYGCDTKTSVVILCYVKMFNAPF